MATISLSLPTSGTTVTAGLHSANYAAIQTAINGGLDNANINASAGIALSKLANYPASVPMVRLYDNTASGAIASWDVSSGLTGYSHFKIVLMARGDTAATSVTVLCRFNNDSGANYATQQVRGLSATASAAESNSATSAIIGTVAASSATTGHVGVAEIVVPHYAGTTFFKNWASYGGWSQAITTSTIAAEARQGVWISTAAINRITILPGAGNFIAGSRLTIYGLS